MRISDWSSDVCSSDLSHYYRQVWYWGGEADLRVNGKKMELTTIPANEWDQVVKDAEDFCDELASLSPRARSEERRVGKECVIRVDLGGRRIITKQKQIHNKTDMMN